MSASVRLLFLGSGGFAVPALERLAADPAIRIVGVVAAPDRPAGRGGALRSVPVARRARELGLPLLQPAGVRDEATIHAIAALAPEVGVLADFGRLVPAALLDLPPHGILNLHPSLLPRHRGASPIPATILAGDPETGVTVIRMDPGLDTGPIVAARRWALDGTETTPELEVRAAAVAAELLAETLPAWLAGTLRAIPQDDPEATLTRPLRREDGRLDPALPAARLERAVRALQPWPGSFVEAAAGRLVVWAAHVAPAEPSETAGAAAGAVGTLVAAGRALALVTAEGRLVLDEVQLEGRRRMGGEELLRGHGARLLGSRVG